MIERYTLRIETVYLLSQWYRHVSNASTGLKSVEVVEMSQAFFMITVNTFEECTLNEQKTKTTTHLIFTMLFGLILEKEKDQLMVN